MTTPNDPIAALRAKVLKDLAQVLEDLTDIALGGSGTPVQLRAAQLLIEFAVPPLVKAPDDLPNVTVHLGPSFTDAAEWQQAYQKILDRPPAEIPTDLGPEDLRQAQRFDRH